MHLYLNLYYYFFKGKLKEEEIKIINNNYKFVMFGF